MPDTITEFVKQDLKARLPTGVGLPSKLTLVALSEHYQVSLTPVRIAVRELVDEQVLVKEANGRMALHPAARPADEDLSPPTRPALAQRIEATLTAEILRQSLRGEAEYLREEATAERFGIGRTALRQVLNRLAGQGLLDHLPRRGWRVRPFDEGEMIAYLQVREGLELKALDLARPHLDRADLRRMLRGNERNAPRLDNDLHRYLIEKAGNRYIRDFFGRHGIYYATLFDYAAPATNVVKAMARQHRTILRALLAENWKGARKALAHHIRSQRPVVLRLLQEIGQSRAEKP
ncbi:MAG: GntR family transcriptional regulator [Gemmataceae bacterium]|nr:GntR family transcriptional regulator [Gemmataceae bacterium]